ncbi:MAG: pantetheine-phosphate adenylyltransferase [Clostridiales bacterium]|jgi:pantetheine-phosphate adenylyltransferase|nr:pantetheine-phosphate adenylyltransferase [Clostridiales bacterium]
MTAIFPGAFDPVTAGHANIIERAVSMFDLLIVAVLKNSAKNSLFNVEERVRHLNAVAYGMSNIEVIAYSGLLSELAAYRGAVIIRGLRSAADAEYEFIVANAHKITRPRVETLFMICEPQFSNISSTVAKEIASYGGDVSSIVPPVVNEALKNVFKED